jgi:putative DNA primase/helicase
MTALRKADLAAALRDDAERAALSLLGPPNKALSTRSELRWGSRGSLKVAIAGSRQGRWRCFEDETGGDILDLAERELGRSQALEWAAQLVGGAAVTTTRRRVVSGGHVTEPHNEARQRRADAIWREADSIRGTASGTYLRRRCGGLPDELLSGAVLRHHPGLLFNSEPTPALIARFRDLRTDEPRGIHRTFVTPDGHKAGPDAKRMLGPVAGAAIKLTADDMVTTGLGLAEGLETALSVMLTGWRPIWALGSAGAIRSFPRLGGIEALTIFADADEAGWSAAEACGERLAAKGVEVRVLAPPAAGEDWNDHLGVQL